MTKRECELIRELLDAYIDGELSANERKTVDRHLEACEECKREIQQIEQLAGSLSALPQLALRRDFADNFESILAQRKSTEANCKEFIPLIDPFHDEELTGPERDRTAGHLESCHDCGGALADIGRVTASLRQLPPIQPPRDFALDIEVVLARSNKVVLFKRQVTWAAAGIAAGLTLIMLVLQAPPGAAPGSIKVASKQEMAHPIEVAANVALPGSTGSVVENGADPTNQPHVRAEETKGAAQRGIAAQSDSVKEKNQAAMAERANRKNEIQRQSRQSEIASTRTERLARGAGNDDVIRSSNGASSAQVSLVGREVASVPVGEGLKGVPSEDIVALYDNGANPAEELGFKTDEDGLYAIKL